eukprot:TRINITY_DN59468_c0_g1_i1.p1 TRINITY_DN59468_c0_g1~~TRINITY_DN59468_c0_g1_i1.p1  ORF type:complete len:210 (+),score=36.76 TRINITY_DN59468_c0_g1_i1:69-698(+)
MQRGLVGSEMCIRDRYQRRVHGRAVNHFVHWAKDLNDTKTRTEFYPTVDKSNLFRDGYIASRSGHSRGSTVDLTIVNLPPEPQPDFILGKTNQKACFLPAAERFRDNGLDMGTGFDCFHELSHPENPGLLIQQRAYRLLLKTLMEKHGFRYYDKEWWHFTLENEPFPDTYFDFIVKQKQGVSGFSDLFLLIFSNNTIKFKIRKMINKHA